VGVIRGQLEKKKPIIKSSFVGFYFGMLSRRSKVAIGKTERNKKREGEKSEMDSTLSKNSNDTKKETRQLIWLLD